MRVVKKWTVTSCVMIEVVIWGGDRMCPSGSSTHIMMRSGEISRAEHTVAADARLHSRK